MKIYFLFKRMIRKESHDIMRLYSAQFQEEGMWRGVLFVGLKKTCFMTRIDISTDEGPTGLVR